MTASLGHQSAMSASSPGPCTGSAGAYLNTPGTVRRPPAHVAGLPKQDLDIFRRWGLRVERRPSFGRRHRPWEQCRVIGLSRAHHDANQRKPRRCIKEAQGSHGSTLEHSAHRGCSATKQISLCPRSNKWNCIVALPKVHGDHPY